MPMKVVPRRDRKLHRLVKKGKTLGLRRGETLYSPGESAQTLILVRTGHVQLVAEPGTEKERVVSVAGPWELTGEEGLFPGVSRKTLARAGERAQVTLLDGEGVVRALRTGSKTYGAFFLAKEEELALARSLTGPRREGSASSHLAALLLHLASRLGRSEEKKGTRIPIRLTHKVLADLAGCHRSTVTTVLNGWIYDGVLRQRDGQLWILRPADLE
ncbi:MAG: Crp/Fnr family transcriptional regulator [Gemmatimonadota bacterium]